jgi:hypothetical protein
MHDRRRFILAGLIAVVVAVPTPTLAFTNTLVNDPTTDVTARDTQSSTSTIVFGSTVLTAFNDTGSSAGGSNRFTGWSRSTDGGVTFTDLGALTSSPSDFGFPFLARNALTGTVYLSTLDIPGIQVSRSFNGGLSFLPPVLATPGVASPNFDREVLAVDNVAGGSNVYVLATDFGGTGAVRFFRSTNDGMAWGPSGGLTMVSGFSVNGPFLAVAPDHSIYAFWFDNSGGPQRLRVRRSIDLGLTFGGAITVATLSTTGPDGDMGLGGFHTNAFPQAVVNPVNSNVYIVYPDNPAGTDRADIFFRQSTDSGASWSAGVRVNDDATTRDQWQPSLAVTPDGSRVFVGWYDRRLDAANIDNYGRIATVSGATVTFGADFRITDQSYPPVFGIDPVLNPTYMGDWDECAADNSFFYYSWGDNRDPSTGHAGNQANVRLAKIPVAGTTSVAEEGVPGAGGGRLALSPKANPFSGALELGLELDAPSRVELDIYDVGGRRIAGTDFGAMGVGTHELAWDGRDSSGRDAGSGTFLAVVRADGRALTTKVVRLR